MKKNKIIEKVFTFIFKNEKAKAESFLKENYSFNYFKKNNRQYSEYQKLKIFIRDGFIDRYSGEEMIFPPVLRIISKEIPKDFPFQKNWKISETHIAYWELIPTIDHIIPVTRGGPDIEENWVSTSQLKNSVKSNWLLEELNWKLHKKGSVKEWDELISWFKKYVKDKPEILKDTYIKKWNSALERIESEK